MKLSEKYQKNYRNLINFVIRPVIFWMKTLETILPGYITLFFSRGINLNNHIYTDICIKYE